MPVSSGRKWSILNKFIGTVGDPCGDNQTPRETLGNFNKLFNIGWWGGDTGIHLHDLYIPRYTSTPFCHPLDTLTSATFSTTTFQSEDVQNFSNEIAAYALLVI